MFAAPIKTLTDSTSRHPRPLVPDTTATSVSGATTHHWVTAEQHEQLRKEFDRYRKETDAKIKDLEMQIAKMSGGEKL